MISKNLQGVLNGQPEQQQPPAQKGIQLDNELTQWVRGSYMISALGPQNVRESMTAAQDAFADMIEGAANNKRPEALAARKIWEQTANAGLQANRQRLIDYGLIWANDQLPLEEKMAALREAALKRGDLQVANIAASPDQFTTFGQVYDQMSKQQQQVEAQTAKLDGIIKMIEGKLPPAPNQPAEGGTPSIDEFVDGWNL